MRTLQVMAPVRTPSRSRFVKVTRAVYRSGNFPRATGVMGVAMAGPSDNELLTRARDGHADGFRMLVDRHKDAMVNYLTRMTGCRVRAEEMAQESFVRLYLQPPRVENGASFAPWLFRVATNLVHSEERRARRARLYGWLLGKHAASNGAAPDQESRMLALEAQRQTQAALAALPVAFRAALVLREIQGLSYEEIGVVLGCPAGTVRSRINRGRALLRDHLAPYWNGERR
jgi:RNA polymerase sigma-70 factor (ECF subfamily)